MSLLDHGRHTLLVYPTITETNAWGDEVQVPSAEPIAVVGSLQPSVSNEQPNLGQVVDTRMRFISRSFPGGPWARVLTEDGREWDVEGEPRVYAQTRAVAHTTVYLKSREANNGLSDPNN